MSTLPISVPGSEFNEFLFAPIGEDKNGMLVSVLSGLARSDVDPWQEAAKLVQLPGEAATKELATLIAALPVGAAPSSDPSTIAARLIALLPGRGALSGRGANDDANCLVGNEFTSLVDRCRLYVLCAWRPILDSKPSTAGEARQCGSEGYQTISSPVVPPVNTGQ